MDLLSTYLEYLSTTIETMASFDVSLSKLVDLNQNSLWSTH